MIQSLLMITGGVALLTIGAEGLVRGAVSVARRVGLSPLVIGLTVVSVGTSMPELVVSVDAVLQGSASLGVGNVVGSNISNIALILGIAAVVRPMQVKAQVIRLDGPILVVVSVLLVVLVQDGALSRLEGLLLAVGVVGYFTYNVWAASDPADVVRDEFAAALPSQRSLAKDLGVLGLGIGGLILGADVLVDGAVHLARLFKVPKIIVGLTLVAVGTSLPELATSVLAAYRGEGDLAIGNAVGSCILNILGILGITAVIQPISTQRLSFLELGTMVGVAVLVLPFFRSDFTLSRQEGGILLVVYAGYLWGVVGGG